MATMKEQAGWFLDRFERQTKKMVRLEFELERVEKLAGEWEQRALKAENLIGDGMGIMLLRRYHALITGRTLYDAGGDSYIKLGGQEALGLNVEVFNFLTDLGIDMATESWRVGVERQQAKQAAANGTGGTSDGMSPR